MIVLMISPSFYPATYYGGPIYSTYQLVKSLIKIGLDIRVITTNSNGVEKLKVKTGIFNKLENDLPVKYFNSIDSRGTSLSMFFLLWKDIKKVDIVYLVSVFSFPTPLTLILCWLYGKPIVLSPCGQLGEWCLKQGNPFKKTWLKFFVKPFLSKINWHLASIQEEEMLIKIYPYAKTFVLPNGIDINNVPGSPQKKDKSYYNSYTSFDCSKYSIIISIGRLHKVKGFDILIDAVKRMIDSDNKVLLFIAGQDFGEKEKLNNHIRELKLQNSVFLIGYIEGKEKELFLSNADVFALASHHENFGMAVVEALAFELPVVISENVAIKKEIMEYEAGLVVKNEPDDFKETILTLLYDRQLREKNSRNGLRLSKERFDVNGSADCFLNHFNRILAGKNA